MNQNPFLTRSELPYEIPPFEKIRPEHYLEGFYLGTQQQLEEVAQILATPEITFENTIEALERSGQILSRMLNVFYNKSSSDTDDQIDAIEAEIAPKLAAHSDSIRLNPELFARVKKLYEEKPSLDAESAWLLERYYRDFIQAGAGLDVDTREQVKRISQSLS